MQATRSFPFRAFSPLSRSQILSLKTERQPISLRRFHKPRSSSHVLTRCLYPRLLLRQPTSLRASHVLRFNSSNATAGTSSSESLSARLKKLSREYGWSALGIYLLLSALDFPFCFLAVRLLGTERIGHWEHTILEGTKRFVSWPWQRVQPLEATEVSGETHVPGQEEQRLLDEQVVANRWDHGVEEAEKANKGENASIWTQLALAYAIHKSFIFLRVPLTAAVTPKVVKTLRSWGWDIGKRRLPKQVTGTGVNANRTGINTGKK